MSIMFVVDHVDFLKDRKGSLGNDSIDVITQNKYIIHDTLSDTSTFQKTRK